MRQTLEEYIEGRMACGSLILGVIGFGAALWLIATLVEQMIKEWIIWVSTILFVVTLGIAVVIAITVMKKCSQKGGLVMLAGAVAQVVLAIIWLCLDWENWQAYFGFVYAAILVGIGIKAITTKD